MGRSQETFRKKNIKEKKAKKRKQKEEKKLAKKENQKKGIMEDMIAYVDENGVISPYPPDPEGKEKIDPEDIVI